MERMKLFGQALWLALCATNCLHGYSVLSHEALVDAMWDVRLRALLVQRYPAATEAELKRAHGYAYGGAIVPDLGYYPRGSPEFSDLTHYVRSGDFILALLHEARDLNEMAFALGALSHYVGDLEGHSKGTNLGEPLLYPKMARKFGKVVTYEDDPATHVKTEFGFDVLEVARGNFAPETYHDFIGFFVAKEALERAFHDTYGLELPDLFANFDLAVAGYRSAASKTIPLATRIAWAEKKKEIAKAQPGMTQRRFVYIMKRSSYEREWGKRLQEPNWLERFLAALLKIIPPIGVLRDLQFKIPTPAVEQLFMASFNSSVKQYSAALAAEQQKSLALPNKNYDTGGFTAVGVYRLDDHAHAFWLHKLAEKKFASVTPEIRTEFVHFYGDPHGPNHTQEKPAEWQETVRELEELQGL